VRATPKVPADWDTTAITAKDWRNVASDLVTMAHHLAFLADERGYAARMPVIRSPAQIFVPKHSDPPMLICISPSFSDSAPKRDVGAACMERLLKSTEVIQKAIDEGIQGNVISLKKVVAFLRTERPDLKDELDELGNDNPLCERVVRLAAQTGKAVLFDLHE
jgi:hypothetical protein